MIKMLSSEGVPTSGHHLLPALTPFSCLPSPFISYVSIIRFTSSFQAFTFRVFLGSRGLKFEIQFKISDFVSGIEPRTFHLSVSEPLSNIAKFKEAQPGDIKFRLFYSYLYTVSTKISSMLSCKG
jgi:hypothetical protein